MMEHLSEYVQALLSQTHQLRSSSRTRKVRKRVESGKGKGGGGGVQRGRGDGSAQLWPPSLLRWRSEPRGNRHHTTRALPQCPECHPTGSPFLHATPTATSEKRMHVTGAIQRISPAFFHGTGGAIHVGPCHVGTIQPISPAFCPAIRAACTRQCSVMSGTSKRVRYDAGSRSNKEGEWQRRSCLT